MRSKPLKLAAAAAAVALAMAASAEDPKFAYAKKDEVAKLPPWTASVTFGFGATTGNSETMNLSGAASVAHNFDAQNRLALDASGTFGRSTLTTAADTSGDGTISPDEVSSITQTVAQAWATKLRYDRFFDLNALYGFVYAAGDEPAGKPFMGGVQVGYARALYKTATAELVAEGGLDYTYQRYVVGPPNAVSIGALRAYVGYVGTPLDYLSYSASVEWLGNLTQEERADRTVGSFGDNRVTGKLALTWKIFGNGSMGFNFRALYNSAPAPRPPPAGFSWAPGYYPLAKEWDTFSELVLVYKLL